jgi:CHAT domain-containing protein
LIEDINAFSLSVPVSGSSWRDDGARLYAKLIAPLGSLGGKQIIIVPSLMMERLPFDALGPKGGKTLVEQKSIVVLPNLLSPQMIREVDQSKAEPLVVGVNGEGLTLAVDEAKSIAKLLGTQALTGRAARIEDISGRLAGASIIHLSTHALLNIENPFASTIELSDRGKPIEGWWLFRQPINARLVTLSACETARGNVGQGEGFPSGLLTGPSFADTFHTVGVRYVVGTMWKVDDNFANPLMIRFYQELQTANEDPVIALTNAKRALIRDGKANAAYLAGFQVSVRSLSDLRVAR